MRSTMFVCLFCCLAVTAGAEFDVDFGDSWDHVPLQDILDAEYGAGAVDVATQYEGYLSVDGDPAYWEDVSVSGFVVREIAGFRNTNIMGWYAEDLSGPPVIDGVDDGVVFSGSVGAGGATTITFPDGLTRFGFWMNPNGSGDAANAPEPELFFTNRFYNDLGPDGSGAIHAPHDGDPQCLVYNVSHLYGGTPTFVLAWEDLDYGGVTGVETDNDFQDMVVEIQALSPVPVESESWGGVKALFR